MSATISPGDLIYARGREWVALPSSEIEWLYLRPLSGSESDIQILSPELERESVRPARFDLPDTNEIATQAAARLLSESLRLSLRRGAGPFRSAARLSFKPRAYQLVPLLLALRLPTVRLLIADDVGIGKTIEAGLILREFIDRGEVDRFSILCPPHLVEQWTEELRNKFDIDAVAVTSASAARLERGLLDSQTLFETYPYTVVSLDYIKADKRRDNFSRACPRFVIVDEAHACIGTHKGKHQRFDLLRRLATDDSRHMIFLTATPHSGDETAYDRLLSLLDTSFAAAALDNDNVRRQLAKHFVQRRRIDITGREWGEDRAFPEHKTKECLYNLDKLHQTFHDDVLDYCLGVVEGAGEDQKNRRLAFWGTLALMRCVGSSPASAVSALRNRLSSDPYSLEEQVFDDDGDEVDAVDIEPTTGLGENNQLQSLILQAEKLVVSKDPKLEAVIKLLKPLLEEGVNPVVFCRFIATAEHVAKGLQKAFPKIRIEAVTGTLTPEERRLRVEDMGIADQRLLVATDCLSEGINLQSLFDTVVHYDLSWNPTRHQQREGRVDRFGQPAPLVRSILLYSPDSAIDGAVLDVILRKAEAIRKATGVTVPLPEERGAVTNALMNAVLLSKGKTQQLNFLGELALSQDVQAVEACWRDAEEGAKKSITRYAQNTIKPEEVAPEWKRWQEVMGTPEQIEQFVKRAMSRLDAPLENTKDSSYLAPLSHLPESVKERLESRDLSGSIRITFSEDRVPAKTELIKRNHPIPATLAETLLEGALDPSSSYLTPLGRMGAWPTQGISAITTVLLLRLRYKLTVHRQGKPHLLLVEEAETIAFQGLSDTILSTGEEARNLLELEASGNLDKGAIDRLLDQARERVKSLLNNSIENHVKVRSQQLAEDHARVRASNVAVPRVSVEAVLPADIIGLFVLVPGGS